MIYLDTSAVVPIFVTEPSSAAIDAWLEACGEQLVSSDWLVTEFSSALSIKVRKGEINAKQSQAVCKGFDGFCASGLRLLPVSRTAFTDAAKMVRDASSGLRAGDSLHLAMAIDAGASGIVTADATLARSAEAKGMTVIRF